MKTIKNIKTCKALMPSKKAQAVLGVPILGAIVIGAIGVGIYLLATVGFGGGGTLAIGQETDDNGPIVIQTSAICPNDLTVSFQADGLNSLDEGATNYTAQTVYLVPDGDFARFTSYATATTSTRTTAVNLDCGSDYVAFGVATQDSVGSLGPLELGTITGGQLTKQFDVQRSSDLKIKAYDLDSRSFVYDDSDADNTDFENVAVTFKGTTDNATATAMTASSTLDWEFTIQTQTANRQFGDIRTIIAIDADKTDYKEPSVWYNGAKLNEAITAMDPDDRAVISGYEYAYVLSGPISDSPNDLRLFLEPKSGVNPDVDAKVRILSESHYLGVDGKTIKTNIFKDSDSSEIYTSTANTITIDIS